MQQAIQLRSFTEPEYHRFFKAYRQDPVMNPEPFVYSEENVSRSFVYNTQYRDHFALLGIFLGSRPVGCFQIKRMNEETGVCEFGIILQNEDVMNRGIGTEAIRQGQRIAAEQYGMRWMMGDTSGRNQRMQRVFEKLGYQLIETVPQAYDRDGGQKDDRLVYMIQIG